MSCHQDSVVRDKEPIDKSATIETVNLYKNMLRLSGKGIMFGHQDALAYGVNWKYVAGKSDIKEVTGDYPAVYGWELGGLENDRAVNLDSVPFNRMKVFIRTGYERGGVIAISWRLNNPLTGKSAWDAAPGTVASILPGGEKHELYKSWLDKLAVFFNSLTGSHGEYIPIIFRPFHELNGSWFWWGKDHCTPEQLKELWHFTISYFRDQKNIHHLLYAFNTDKFSSAQEYLERYPDDEWADITGFDVYQRITGDEGNKQFINEVGNMLSMLESLAAQRGKIPAITEFGFNGLPDPNWWTNVFWEALKSHKISYALAWRNAGFSPDGSAQYYAPYKGEPSENDFRKLYSIPSTLFQKDITEEKIYSH